MIMKGKYGRSCPSITAVYGSHGPSMRQSDPKMQHLICSRYFHPKWLTI